MTRNSPEIDPARSRQMSLVRGKDTKPELIVRRLAHKLGYRFRLHRKDLPGTPDLVFPARRAVIFVHGCFWHQHRDPTCKRARFPKSRQDFWGAKLQANQERDTKTVTTLEGSGWRVLTIWECELKNREVLADRISGFLGPPAAIQ